MMRSIPARTVKCVFCGHGGPWWGCACQQVQEVRAGKRPKPKVIFRDGVPILIVDRETVQANHLGLRATELTKSEARKIQGLDLGPEQASEHKSLEDKESGIGGDANGNPLDASKVGLGGDGGDSQVSGRARGGVARAQALTPEQRREIARAAAAKRWKREGV